jgi:hypothetical protein
MAVVIFCGLYFWVKNASGACLGMNADISFRAAERDRVIT